MNNQPSFTILLLGADGADVDTALLWSAMVFYRDLAIANYEVFIYQISMLHKSARKTENTFKCPI